MENLFKNVKPKSKDLYISNLKRLNTGITGSETLDINNLDFLQDVDKVLDFLNSKYAKTTIRSFFIAICSLLSELAGEPHRPPSAETNVVSARRLYDKYYPILISQNKSLEINNTKSEKQTENWITQEEVNLKRLEYEMAAHSILENGSPFKQKEWNVILDWVIISLYSLIPPRRALDFCEMNIVKSLRRGGVGDPTPGEYVLPEPNINYYVVKDKKFIFTNYKTAGTYNTQIQDVPNELSLILDIYIDSRPPHDSLRSSPPRGVGDPTPDDMPLFVNYKGKAIRENYNITKHLNSIFDDKKISVDMLRNIYLTTNFKENLTNLKETATAMGTSPDVIQNHYVKLDSPPTPLNEEIPPTEPKSKNIKINKITKLKEEIPPTEIINKNLTINRSKSQAKPRGVGDPTPESQAKPTPEEEDEEQPRTSKKSLNKLAMHEALTNPKKIQRLIIEDDEDDEEVVKTKLTDDQIRKIIKDILKSKKKFAKDYEELNPNKAEYYESRTVRTVAESQLYKLYREFFTILEIKNLDHLFTTLYDFEKSNENHKEEMEKIITKYTLEGLPTPAEYDPNIPKRHQEFIDKEQARLRKKFPEAYAERDQLKADYTKYVAELKKSHPTAKPYPFEDWRINPRTLSKPKPQELPPKVKIYGTRIYFKDVIDKVRKIWNKLDAIDAEKYPEKYDKIYKQLEDIDDDALEIATYFDKGLEPPVTK